MNIQKVFILGLAAVILASCSESKPAAAETSSACLDRSISKVDVPSNAVFIGNSLIMGNGTFGVSASDISKDYFSIIKSTYEKLNPDYKAARVSGKMVEKTTDQKEARRFLAAEVAPTLSDSTDLVVIQLGDNFTTPDELTYMDRTVGDIYETVCTNAPHARVVWVGEWYSTEQKQNILKKMAEMNQAEFIDISDINIEDNQGRVGDIITYPDWHAQEIEYSEYTASGDTLEITFVERNKSYTVTLSDVNSYEDDEKNKKLKVISHQGIVTDTDVATHPNDKGFQLIAERILEGLNYGN